MKKNRKYTWGVLLVVIAYLLFEAIFGSGMFSNKIEADLVSCIDGDTVILKLNDKTEKVRLLAIDTPERNQPYYRKASEFTCNLLKDSDQVFIEMDKNTSYDAYERLLAWVWVDADLLQSKLVENGYAKVAYLYDDYKYTDKLLKLQKIANQQKINLWSLPHP